MSQNLLFSDDWNDIIHFGKNTTVYHKEFTMSKFLSLVMFTLIVWLRCILPVFTTIFTFFSFVQVCMLGQMIWNYANCFSSNLCPLILSFINESSLQHLLLWCLPNNYFLPSILINWNSTVRKLFLLPHLFVYSIIYL